MIKLSENKELTEHKPIQKVKSPGRVSIPLSQHFGKPCDKILVNPADYVKTGQMLATCESGLFGPVHASISGKVLSVSDYPHPILGNAKAVIIESDGKDEKFYPPSLKTTGLPVDECGKYASARCHQIGKPSESADNPDENAEIIVREFRHGLRVGVNKGTPGLPVGFHSSPQEPINIESLSIQQLREKIFNAGIVGMGGAGFPAHVKLNPPKKIEYFVLNGAECEPYLNSDYRLMLEQADKIIIGAKIVLKILGIMECIVAIEDNKKEAIGTFKRILPSGFKLKILKTQYPQGGEKQLIQSTLNREVPSGGLPFDIGVVVQNVGTVYAIYEAVYENKPLYERVVTLTGNCLREPGNFLVRIGTTVRDLIEACGGLEEDPAKVIFGGPMMGIAQYTLDVPVIKTTSGIILFSKNEIIKKEERVCCRCARCIDECPARIMPAMISMAAEKERWDIAKDYDALDCIECGLCSYVCPAKRDLVHLIKYAKSRIKK